MKNQNSEPNLKSLKYAEEIARAVLDQQFNSIDSLITGASVLIGLTSVLIGIILAGGITKNELYSTSIIVISLCGLISSLFLALFAAKSTDFKYIFHPRKLWEYTAENELEIRKQVYSKVTEAFEDNEIILKSRWNLLRYSMIILIFSVILLTISIVMNLAR